MDNTEFLAQQAQFTQISELQKLNQTNSFVQASSLIGQEVSFKDPGNGQNSITGTVTEAKVNSKGASIVINDQEFLLSDVVKNGNNMAIRNTISAE
jgi:flagellar hook assembly protein FlgD